MSHTDVEINWADAFKPDKGIAGVKTFINSFAYIFAIMVVILLVLIGVLAGWITITAKSRFSGPDMWSTGNAMQYQCIDLAGQSHCGPGGEGDDTAERFRRERNNAGGSLANRAAAKKGKNTVSTTMLKPVNPRSNFLNVRGSGVDQPANQQVIDYYNNQLASGDNYTYTGGDTGTTAAVANANAAVAAAANASAAASAANTAANAAIAAANASPAVTAVPATATTNIDTSTTPATAVVGTNSYFGNREYARSGPSFDDKLTSILHTG